MSIFLRFRNTKLSLSQGGQILSVGIGNIFLMESHFLIGNSGVIVGEADKIYLFSGPTVKEAKVIITEAMTDLSCSIRTEVKENASISVRNKMSRSIFLDNRR